MRLLSHEKLSSFDEARLLGLVVLLEQIEGFLPFFELAFVILLSEPGLGAFLLCPESFDFHSNLPLLVRQVVVVIRLLSLFLPSKVFVCDVADSLG